MIFFTAQLSFDIVVAMKLVEPFNVSDIGGYMHTVLCASMEFLVDPEDNHLSNDLVFTAL